MSTALRSPSPSNIALPGDPAPDDHFVDRAARVSDLTAENARLRADLERERASSDRRIDLQRRQIESLRRQWDETKRELRVLQSRASLDRRITEERDRYRAILTEIRQDRIDRGTESPCFDCHGTGADWNAVAAWVGRCDDRLLDAMEPAEQLSAYNEAHDEEPGPCTAPGCFEGDFMARVTS